MCGRFKLQRPQVFHTRANEFLWPKQLANVTNEFSRRLFESDFIDHSCNDCLEFALLLERV